MPELCKEIFAGNTNWNDFAMGMSCMILLKCFELMKRRYQDKEGKVQYKKIYNVQLRKNGRWYNFCE
jgi:hypothetical protein